MREYKVRYYIEKDGVRSEEYETVPVQASSVEEAIDLVKDYLQEQVAQYSEYTADIQKDVVIVSDGEDVVETYCNFSADSGIKGARIEVGISRAEMSRLFEIPIRTLENWESGTRIPPHWAEKLIIEKLEKLENIKKENGKMKRLNNVTKIRFNDFSEYESGKSNNAGCYGFWTDYTRLENGLFEVSHGTTADFEFCPVCGDFHAYNEEECGEYKTVTESELLKLINDFEETEDCYIELEAE